MYAPSSPLLWFWGEHPPISGSERGDLEQVSLPGGQLVKQVAVGRRHVVALTTMGEGHFRKLAEVGDKKLGDVCLPLLPPLSCLASLLPPPLPLYLPIASPLSPLSVLHRAEQLCTVWISNPHSTRSATVSTARQTLTSWKSDQGTIYTAGEFCEWEFCALYNSTHIYSR